MNETFLDQVRQRAELLRETIAANAVRPVTLVAVTKRFGPDAVKAALAAGIADIGENYAQELGAKAQDSALAGLEPRWHFIGHLQTNKVRQICDIVSLWQTVDSAKLGHEIAKRAPGARVLVQVNQSGAENQSGIAPTEVRRIVEELRGMDLDVRGLMTIGEVGDLAHSSVLFGGLRAMADDLDLEECSMGMTHDLVPALQQGATLVRVGTGLFGPRG